MNKFRKTLIAVLCALCLVCGVFFISACEMIPEDELYYTVTLNYNEEQGTVTKTDPESPAGYVYGESVTITVTPNEGYEVDAVVVNSSAVTLTSAGNYTFKVKGKTTVNVTFKAETDEPPVVKAALVLDEYYHGTYNHKTEGSIVANAEGTTWGDKVVYLVENNDGIYTVEIDGVEYTLNVDEEGIMLQGENLPEGYLRFAKLIPGETVNNPAEAPELNGETGEYEYEAPEGLTWGYFELPENEEKQGYTVIYNDKVVEVWYFDGNNTRSISLGDAPDSRFAYLPTGTTIFPNSNSLIYVRAIDPEVDVNADITFILKVHEHNYSKVGHNDNQHWNYCPDDNEIDPQSYAAHSFTYNEETGEDVCDCGYSKTHQHTLVWQSNATSHWQECKECDYKSAEVAHDWSAWTADEGGKTHSRHTICNAEHETYTEQKEHALEWKSNATSHWQECKECDYKTAEVAHDWSAWTADGDSTHSRHTECEADHKEYTETDNHNSDGHDNNADGHWDYCTDCEYEYEHEDHSFTYDADTDKDVCDCGYAKEHEHHYTEVGHDNEQHWNYCSDCGEEKPESRVNHTWTYADNGDGTHNKTSNCADHEEVVVKEAHNYVEGTCSDCECEHEEHSFTYDAETGKDVCDECGYSKTHEHTLVWQSNETEHWQYCTACGEKVGQTAHAWSNWTLDESDPAKHTRTSNCSEHEQQYTESEVHNYVEGTCDECGAADPEYVIEYTVTVNYGEGKSVKITVKEGDELTLQAIVDAINEAEAEEVTYTVEDIAKVLRDGEEYTLPAEVYGDLELTVEFVTEEEPEVPETEIFVYKVEEEEGAKNEENHVNEVGGVLTGNDQFTITVLQRFRYRSLSGLTFDLTEEEGFAPTLGSQIRSNATSGDLWHIEAAADVKVILYVQIASADYTANRTGNFIVTGADEKTVPNGGARASIVKLEISLKAGETADVSFAITSGNSGTAWLFAVEAISTVDGGEDDVEQPGELKDVALNFGRLANIDELVASWGETNAASDIELYNDGKTVITAMAGIKINKNDRNFHNTIEEAIDLKFTHRLQTSGGITAVKNGVKLEIADAAVITVYVRSSSSSGSAANRQFGFYSADLSILQQEEEPAGDEDHIYTYTADAAGTILLGGTNGFAIYYITVEYGEVENPPVEPTTEYTVTFVYDDDETENLVVETVNQKVAKPEEPEREGYKFIGWFNGEEEWNFEADVTENMTLTAKWEEVKPEEPKIVTATFANGKIDCGDSSTFKNTGNASSSQNNLPVTIDGVTYSSGLKIESSTALTVTPVVQSTLTLYFVSNTKGAATNGIAIDGQKYTLDSGVKAAIDDNGENTYYTFTITLDASTHTITNVSGQNVIFYAILAPVSGEIETVPGETVDNPAPVPEPEVEGQYEYVNAEGLTGTYYKLPENEEQLQYTVEFDEEVYAVWYYDGLATQRLSAVGEAPAAGFTRLESGAVITPNSNSVLYVEVIATGAVESEVVAVAAHTVHEWVEGECKVCGETHDHGENLTTETSDTHHWEKCSVCGYIGEEAAHTGWTEWADAGEGKHSHQTTCEGHDPVVVSEEHDYNNDACTECGAENPDYAQVKAALAEVSATLTVDKEGDTTLPKSIYDEVTFEWTVTEGSDEVDVEINQNGTLTVKALPEVETTITLTVTATHNNGAHATKEVKVTIAAASKEPEEIWELVTDASALTEGSVIIIAYETNVLGKDSGTSTRYRLRVSNGIEINDDGTVTILNTDDISKITLEVGYNGVGLAFSTSEGYLYWSSGNSLPSKSNLDKSASWTVTIGSEGAATITNQNDTSRLLQYNKNSGSERFACYTTSQKTPVIYKLRGTGVDPSVPVYYSVTYIDEMGATGNLPQDETKYLAGAIVNILESELTLEGYTFEGWNDGEKTYVAGTQYVMPAHDVTFTAQWKANPIINPEEIWELVTDASALTEGSVIIIAYETNVLGKDSGTSTRYRLRVSNGIEINDDGTVTILNTDDISKITLEVGYNGVGLAFSTSEGYLYWSSGNSLPSKSNLDKSASWTVTIGSEGAATITNQNDTSRLLQYNAASGSERFACYTGSQETPVIYKLRGTGVEPSEPVTYTVKYEAGEGATGTAPESNEYKGNDTFRLPQNTFTREGFTFDGWNDGKKTYQADDWYTMPAHDVTFTAQWKANTTTEPDEGYESQEVTLSYPGDTTVYMSGDNDAAMLGADAKIFNIWSVKNNGGSNHVGLNKDGTIRLYYNHNVTLHIEFNDAYVNAYVIESIKVTLGGTGSLTDLAVEVGGQSVSGTDGFYAINDTAVSLYNSKTTNTQIHVKSIVVTYKQVAEVGGGETNTCTCEGCTVENCTCTDCENCVCDSCNHTSSEVEPEPSEKKWTKVTSVDQLIDGATIIIAAGTGKNALGTSYNSVAVTLSDDMDTMDATVLQITLKKGSSNGQYYLMVGEKYIYSTATKTDLSEKSEQYSWTIEISGSTTKMTPQDTSHGTLQFNSSGYFRPYTSSQSAISIYVYA